MNVRIEELMAKNVVTVTPTATVDRVRRIFSKNSFGAIPVVNSDNEPVGIISTTDLVEELNGSSPISSFMTTGVETVSSYANVDTAAALMRRKKIHRVVVTHEKQVVGMLTTFDLLELVEGKRFTANQPPTPRSKGGSSN